MRSVDNEQKTHLNTYAIFNGTSEENALKHFYRLGGHDAKPLWSGTVYAEWHDVMPYMADVSDHAAFLTWEQQEAPDDWGIIITTEDTFENVFKHFRSLTQVWMPSSGHAFFRFYDPRFSLNVAQCCNDEQRSDLMGPCICWNAKNRSVTNTTPTLFLNEKPFPWWDVPKDVVKQLNESDKSTLIANSVKWLRENHADLYFYYPENTLQAKITRLVNRHKEEFGSLNQFLKTSLDKEVYR
ncbi:hypothetical protein BCT30_22575 [Enterovibrio norvegicus]|uniref:DUF4123 domain-containing protein n=1 Tax=Enterovibrio norvegicus TaxID=188144 RepID=UPI000C865056|nr:DUF4123 domain-containing protein [Enterovibrio norvegicus]MCC4797671.1 DUF4123 domain-containing protein [Enterovibrio norvegicus]PMI25620.1 hypothetical protein BCU47_23685 [Enterovibrio norvegicus]PMI33956.1 hypothetical protein BCU46_21255 [Enterovibrio norvegicus]PMN46160.1 hypothetical protein BCT30_22575 [Enterovibrio norvegicus]